MSRVDVICNGTDICGCDRCPASIKRLREIATANPNLVCGKFIDDQYVIDWKRTEYVRSFAKK
jgi:hypothetical protein